MARKLIVANWKMNGGLARNEALVSALAGKIDTARADCALCVPFPYLAQVGQLVADSGIMLGGQSVHERESGAHTGDVSAAMLAEFGCRVVITGHSERRQAHAESNEQVAAQAAMVVAAGMTPIVCVGETQKEHQAGQLEAVLQAQLEPLAQTALTTVLLEHVVIAYEPVWAIGSGEAATIACIRKALGFIVDWLHEAHPGKPAAQVLYGGSVRADNAAEIFALDTCSGGLIGGASLLADEFAAICASAY